MTSSAYAKRLTIGQAQKNQPWAVPYSAGVQAAADGNDAPPFTLVPHILGSHTVLHAIESLGKIAAVYEARDHRDSIVREFGSVACECEGAGCARCDQ